jgi:DNA-binding SARP family transcriptional activator
MDGARIQLLDGFALETSDSRRGLSRGAQRLVAYLALCRRVHRSVTAGVLWSDASENHALANLRTTIWRVNRLVPGLVHADGVFLSLAPWASVDCREQETHAMRLLRAEWDLRALGDTIESLRHAELLPGWYDDWVVYERERLTQLRLHALERLARELTVRRQLDPALVLALEAFRTEPLRETATAALMAVYLAEGNVSAAVRQFELFGTLLRRELGISPSPGLAALLTAHRS